MNTINGWCRQENPNPDTHQLAQIPGQNGALYLGATETIGYSSKHLLHSEIQMEYLYGLLNLSLWGYVIVTIVMIQISMMGVTLYLHRDQAHRAVDLHPVLRHFFPLLDLVYFRPANAGVGCRASQASRILRDAG